MKRMKMSIIAAAAAFVLAACGGGSSELDASMLPAASAEASSGSSAQTASAEAAASGDETPAEQDFFAMDTYMAVSAYGQNKEEAVAMAKKEIDRLDALLSSENEDSEVAELNRNGGGKVSQDVAALLNSSLQLFRETDGAFDIAIFPVMELWGFPTGNFRVPGSDELKEALALTDASQIDFDQSADTVLFRLKGMKIDFGGIAKGYASSRTMDIFREEGVTSALVNLGGNVQTLGTKPDGSLWKVGIESPKKDGSVLGVLSVSDKAVITSGAYERYFEKDGKTYHHIIDPSTGYPSDSGLTSVTIVSADGTLADGLSTSLFIMGKEKATAFWREHHSDFDMILLDEDNTLTITEGIADAFKTDYKTEVVTARQEK